MNSAKAIREQHQRMGAVFELIGEVLEAQDRACHQLREQRDEGREIEEFQRRIGVFAGDIDQIADRVEHIERHADRQDQAPVDAQTSGIGAEQLRQSCR